MARSPAEIQADVALTRRGIERQLEAIERRVPRQWWTPYAIFAGALATGVLLARVPVGRVVGLGARTVQTAITVASVLAAIDRFMAERRRLHAT